METTRSFHYDQTPINKVETMSNGALRLFGTVANTGWLTYYNPDGRSHREYVSEEVLFDKEHLYSIAGSVLTNGHPPEEITPDNYKQYAAGSIGTKILANPEHGLVDVVVVVNDRAAIDDVNNGKNGLSMGYWAITQDREDSDLDQIKRICNHISIEHFPRAEKAFLRTDGIDSWTSEYTKNTVLVKEDKIILPEPSWKILSVTL